MTNVKSDIAPVFTQKNFAAVTASTISSALVQWFQKAQRTLNFRQTRDPYCITVSEFMLQQTTVAAVQPYYERFMERFPTVQDLAAASEDDVLQYWAGLGYYRRARQLRSAAIEVVERWGGQFPQSVKDLQSLPGFGRYTAGAVHSFAYDLPAPILEANTVRVFARLAGEKGLIGHGPYMQTLWAISTSLVTAADSPRLFNLGAMELGALICKPMPKCDVCPVQGWCVAYKRGEAQHIPQSRPRPEKKRVTVVCAAIANNSGEYLVRRIPAGEWHSGLWEFPTRRLDSNDLNADKIKELFMPAAAAKIGEFALFGTLKYTVTHHEVTCHIFHCHADIEAGDVGIDGDETVLIPLDKIEKLAMGSAQRKLLNLLVRRATEGTTI